MSNPIILYLIVLFICVGTTSFFPAKPLGCYGDGGACFTNDKELAIKIRALKQHGGLERFVKPYIGVNARLDTLQAAILDVKLDYFDDSLKKRRGCAEFYNMELSDLEKDKHVKLPKLLGKRESSWAVYPIIVKSKAVRDDMVQYLKTQKVNVAIYYPVPLHYMDCFSSLGYHKGSLPITERIVDTVFNLPCYPELTMEEKHFMVSMIKAFFCSDKV